VSRIADLSHQNYREMVQRPRALDHVPPAATQDRSVVNREPFVEGLADGVRSVCEPPSLGAEVSALPPELLAPAGGVGPSAHAARAARRARPR
jgi:hypothetical protein